MKRSSWFILTALSSLIQAQAAIAWDWNLPDHGFVIETQKSGPIGVHSGAKVAFSGRVKVVGMPCKHLELYKLDLRELLKAQGVQVRAYFPDLTHEVTPSLRLDRSLAFTYETPVLEANGLNQLTVVVSHESPELRELQTMKVKVDLRVQLYDGWIAELETQNPTAPELADLRAQRSELRAVSARLALEISRDAGLLAQTQFALQVDNRIASSSVNSTVAGDFRVSLESTLGSAIEGEQAHLHGSVQNLRTPSAPGVPENPRKWLAKFYWHGVLISDFTPRNLLPGESIEFDHETEKLSPTRSNLFSASFYPWREQSGGGGKPGTLHASFEHQQIVADDSIAPQWQAGSTPDAQHPYVRTMQPVYAQALDAFGLVDPATFKAVLTGTQIDGTVVNQDVTSQLSITTLDQGQRYQIAGDLNPLAEGLYNLAIVSKDLAGNSTTPNPLATEFRVDRTPPVITLGVTDHYLTNQPAWNIPVTVLDHSAIQNTVTRNGALIAQSSAPLFNVPVTLVEGLNLFEIVSTDGAGNTSTVQLIDVVLDTIPPVLSGLSPINDQVVSVLQVPVSGSSNEPLSYSKVNNVSVTLSANKKAFSGTYVASVEGPLTLQWEAADLAGNVTTQSISVDIILKVLNENLLSVVADPDDGIHLWIRGAPGATRPGLTVNANAGFFNQGSAIGGPDGSFEIKLSAFSTAYLSAYDPSVDRTETATVHFGTGANSRLSGTVRDTEDRALAGATVRIVNSGLSAVTDASGVFVFSQPVSGDQILEVDGTTIPPELDPGGPARKFSKTKISITIGITQSDVLSRPIYLAPIPLDGSATTIDAAQGGEVVSAAAPGVTLEIPAGATHFPDGASSGQISMATINAARSTIEAPAYAAPQQVVALEPSGLSFDEPVELKMPNTLGLNPGIDVVVMSMNSQKGIWEIDGVATVSEDGQNIVTKPGMGITHFSIVYMAPPAPKVSQIGAKDKIGADTFNGALTTSISLPSYKSLGSDIAPSLSYSSAWARPTALMTNLLKLPRENIIIDRPLGGGGLGTLYRVEASQKGRITQGPKEIRAKFSSTGVDTGVITFDGTILPERSALSFQIDLKDQDTGQYLPTKVYPYVGHYEIDYETVVVSYIEKRRTRWWGSPEITQDHAPEQRELEKIFPPDLTGSIYVQNQVESPVGTGWRLNGVQKIANPQENIIVVDEADGALSTYSISNTITTLVNGSQAGLNLSKGADIQNWPKFIATGTDNALKEGSLETGAVQSNLGPLPMYSGQVSAWRHINNKWDGWDDDEGSICMEYVNAYQIAPSPEQILRLSPSLVVGSDSNYHSLFSKGGSSPARLSGTFINTPTYSFNHSGSPYCESNPLDCPFKHSFYSEDRQYAQNLCNGTRGMTCVVTRDRAEAKQDYSSCGPAPVSSGLIPTSGASENGVISSRSLNDPKGITQGPGPNTFVVADSGNHVVRLVNLNTNQMTTIAGTGNTHGSHGDGGLAVNAVVYHPRGVTYDTAGNLYISQQDGKVRVVAPNGIITTLVGSASNPTPGDNIPAAKAILNNPYGMVVDNDNGYLYIAETGAHMVKRVDLQTNVITAVAGKQSTAGFNGDNIAALNANLSGPTHVGLDADKNLLILDAGNQRIRRVTFQNTSTGTIAFEPTSLDHSKLIRNPDGTWTRTYRNGNQVFLDAQGKQTRSQDRVGRQVNYAYNGAGNLASVTDAAGRITQYTYSGDHLYSITDPAGRMTRFYHDSSGHLISVVLPDGSSRQFGYNAESLMTSETNQRSFTTQYVYNEWRRLEKVIRPDLSTVTVNDSGSVTAANNYTGGNLGQLKEFGSENSQVTESLKDAVSAETKLTKDENGYITKIVGADQKSTEIVRDLKGKPVSIKRPDGTTVTYVYDSNSPIEAKRDDLLSQTDTASGITTSQTYDDYGNVTSQTNARSYTSYAVYHPTTGLVTSKTNALNQTLQYSYFPLGLISSQTNSSLNQTTSYTYDSVGNVLTVTDPMNQVTQYTYDLVGNMTSVRNAKNQLTQYEYDSMNRLTAVISPKNERTEYTYLLSGELSQIKDAQNNITAFTYDSVGRMLTKTDPLGQVLARTYDPNGNVSTETDPNGALKQFVYDVNNRMIQKTMPDNVIDLAYDDRGNMTLAKNHQSQVDLDYDDAGRLLHARTRGLGALASLPDVTLEFGYDLNGNRTSLQGPSGTSTYIYDAGDRLTSLTNPKGETYGFGYDQGSRLTSMSRPGGQSVLMFDQTNFLTSVVHSSGPINLASFTYVRDAIGNRTEIQTSAGNRLLGYDANSQLISASNPEVSGAMGSEIFTYDSIHNRATDQSGSYTYDNKSQRLQEDYRYLYYYDNNGNLTKKQAKVGFPLSEVTNYTYSTENQLLSFKVYEPGQTDPVKEVSYAYDAMGRRIQKVVVDHRSPSDPNKTYTRRYVYDGQEILHEYNGSNQLLATYTHSSLRTDDVLAVDVTTAGVSSGLASANGSYQYLKDAQGTVTDVANNAGNKIQHYIYSAFGVLMGIQDAQANDVTSSPPLNTIYTYTGRELDRESGFYYYRARYYDPNIGRFLQKDPKPGSLSVPSSLANNYSYTANNPSNLKDSSGKSWFGDFFATLGAIAVAPFLMMASAFVLPFDPALAFSMFLVGFQFSPVGLGLNIFSGNGVPYMSFFEGSPFVRNSIFGGGANHGFTPGPVAFIGPVVYPESLSPEQRKTFEQDLLRHEYGHILQYQKYGGWEYISQGLGSAGNANSFECEAGSMAQAYFNSPYPYHVGYQQGCNSMGY